MGRKIKPRKAVATIWSNNVAWFWQLNGSNGRTVALCRATGYSEKRYALNALRAAKTMDDGEVYDYEGIWYWRVDDSKGGVLACCPTTGYSSKRNARNALETASRALREGFYTERYPDERKAA